MRLDKAFYYLGYKIAKYPILFIIITFLSICLLLTGLVFLEFEVIIK